MDPSCNCEFCNRRVFTEQKKVEVPDVNTEIIEESKKEKWIKMGGYELTFPQFLDHLVSSSKRLKGAPIKVPETIFYQDKKPRDLFLYSAGIREFRHIPGPYNIPKLIKVIVDAQQKRAPTKERSKLYTIAMVRLRANYKLLTESELIKYMMERPSNKQWHDVEYIQSYILNRNGLATPFLYNLDATVDKHNPGRIVSYALSQFDKAIEETDSPEYFKYLATTLGQYFHTVHNLDLLSGKFTFMQDKENKIWLSHAREVYVRETPKIVKRQGNRLELMKAKYSTEESITEQFANLDVESLAKVQELSSAMSDHYKEMREITGINNDELEGNEDYELDKTFGMLRPRAPYKFTEMVSLEFDPKEILKKRMDEGTAIAAKELKIAEVATPEEIMSAYLYDLNPSLTNKSRSPTRIGRTMMTRSPEKKKC